LEWNDDVCQIELVVLVLAITKLTKRYGAHAAVSSLSLSVAAGEIYALLGPNGAGKSTTISCVLGFIAADSGSIRIGDGDLAISEAAIAHAAYISENVALYEKLTGVENVALFMSLQGQKPNTAKIEAMLADADVPKEAWDRLTETYSKGMRQKVGVVIALANSAKLLVLDEPTSGLDPQASVAFGKLMRNLADQGTAILMATHDLFRAQELADRCGMLVNGELVGEWTRASLGAGELERLYLQTLAGAHQENDRD
jgi:ABC-2 type transport system ATP-binding protein